MCVFASVDNMYVEIKIFILLLSSLCFANSTDIDRCQVIIENGILKSVIPSPTQDNKFLDLSSFKLCDISPCAFDNVTYVTSLDVTIHRLFNLSENAFSNLTNLERLKIRNLDYPDRINGNQFSELRSLKLLDLSDALKVGFDVNAFSGLPDDCELAINEGVECLEPRYFGIKSSSHQVGNRALYKYNCTYYPFSLGNLIEQDKKLSNKKTRSVHDHKKNKVCIVDGLLERVESKLVDDCIDNSTAPYSSILFLNKKGIKSFKKNWYQISNAHIDNVFIEENKIEGIDENVLNDLPRTVRAVLLNKNRIRSLRNNVICNKNIQRLEFKSNEMESIESDAFRGMNSLLDLNLRYNNRIDDLNFVASLPNTLLRLDLGANNITDIPDNIFCHLSKLVFLDLSYNKIKTIGEKTLVGLKKLSDLDLWGNSIEQILNGPYDDLRCMQNLNFCNNEISVIEKGFAKHMNNLQFLNLNIPRNMQSKLERGLFYGLPAGSTVYISPNVKSVEVGIFRKFVNGS